MSWIRERENLNKTIQNPKNSTCKIQNELEKQEAGRQWKVKKNKRVQTNDVLGTQTGMTILSNPTEAVCSKVKQSCTCLLFRNNVVVTGEVICLDPSSEQMIYSTNCRWLMWTR